MSKKIALFNCKPKEGPQKCPVYLKLPWIGKISLNFEKQTKIAINRCYQAVESCIIFTTRKILPAVHKNVLPSLQQSMVVYQCVCRCDWRYVDRTSQRLQDRINQHIPRCIRSDKRPTKNLPNRECKITTIRSVYSDSAIGQHLLENEEYAKHFSDVQFFPFWLQQDLGSIYQFWKQPTSTPYSLFSAVKRNSFIHSKFHINFFFHFSDETETIFFHQSNCQIDQSENGKKFFMFSILLTLYNFGWFLQHFMSQ